MRCGDAQESNVKRGCYSSRSESASSSGSDEDPCTSIMPLWNQSDSESDSNSDAESNKKEQGRRDPPATVPLCTDNEDGSSGLPSASNLDALAAVEGRFLHVP